MTADRTIDILRERIAQALAERAIWHAAGVPQRRVAAENRVAALVRQFDARQRVLAGPFKP